VAGSGWKEKFRKLPYGKGIGIACSAYMTGTQTPIYFNKMPHSGVQIKLDRSGGVCVFCGSVEIGQGSDSILAYIVAEVLGIDPFDIKVVTGDTDLTPVDLGSYSSRVTLMTGNAAIQAAERAREILRQAVSEKLEVPGPRLAFANRRVFDTENPEKGMSFVDAVWLAEEKFGTLGTTGSYKPPSAPGKFKDPPSVRPGLYVRPRLPRWTLIETGIVVVPRI
jgi:CO/xanthine dehydrogenase Mo-binding subunit